MNNTTLSHLPDPTKEGPRFIFCATNVATGACWHFHGGPRARMGDFYTGYFDAGDVAVAEAVAASSAFPPGFGGLKLVPPRAPDRVDPWESERKPTTKAGRLIAPKSGQAVMLTDGGVYDNLGVEPVWERCRTLLVSDAGHPFTTAANSWQALVPRLARAADIAAEQVGAVRKRWMIERIQLGDWLRQHASSVKELPPAIAGRDGTIWAIDTPPQNFPVKPTQCYGDDALALLANIRTDLNAFSDDEQMFLINHGYWLADAGIQQHATKLAAARSAAFHWPYPLVAPGGQRSASVLRSSGKRRILRDVARWVFRVDHRPPPGAPQGGASSA
jgi:NTE family protein